MKYQLQLNQLIIPLRIWKKNNERQFSWDGCLLKSNGDQRLRFSQFVWKTNVERKSIRKPNCEKDISNKFERMLQKPNMSEWKAYCQRIKLTPGITGLSFLKVHNDEKVWHLDVDLTYPGAEEGSKGTLVQCLKCYMSWV